MPIQRIVIPVCLLFLRLFAFMNLAIYFFEKWNNLYSQFLTHAFYQLA